MQNKCILIGDINIDYLKINQFLNFRNFSDLMTENRFKMLIDRPTHCSSMSGQSMSCIDHIWRNFDVDCKSGIIDCLIADHLPVFISFKTQFTNHIIKKIFRDFSKENIDKLNERKQDSYDIINYNVNIAINNFNKWIENVLNVHFPIKCKYMSLKRLKMR